MAESGERPEIVLPPNPNHGKERTQLVPSTAVDLYRQAAARAGLDDFSVIKGAGGTVVDHDGNDFGEADFAPTKVQQLLGGAKNVVTFAVHHLAR